MPPTPEEKDISNVTPKSNGALPQAPTSDSNSDDDSEVDDDDIPEAAYYQPLPHVALGDGAEESNQLEYEPDAIGSSDVMTSTDDIAHHHPPSSRYLPAPPPPPLPTWSPRQVDNVPMDEDQIQLIKCVMTCVRIPEAAKPNWADLIPEDKWKDELVKQLHRKG